MADLVVYVLGGGIALAAILVFIPYHIRETRWHLDQRRRMETDRPPLSDDEFLRSVSAEPGEGPHWLAVRRAVADSIGLPREAIQPQDRLADLWRLRRWLGPDILDIVFRLERSLVVKIPRSAIEGFDMGIYSGQPGEFAEFAAAVVRAIAKVSRSATS